MVATQAVITDLTLVTFDTPSQVGYAPAASVGPLNWRAFERLVGDGFKRRGYTVTGFGGSGADGAVDLGLVKNGERYLVHCKHWHKPQVGVTVVRQLNLVIAAQRASGAFVVTGGHFSREAREFAQTCPVELIDADGLAQLIGLNCGQYPRCAGELHAA